MHENLIWIQKQYFLQGNVYQYIPEQAYSHGAWSIIPCALHWSKMRWKSKILKIYIASESKQVKKSKINNWIYQIKNISLILW